jgi:hypothetical protein
LLRPRPLESDTDVLKATGNHSLIDAGALSGVHVRHARAIKIDAFPNVNALRTTSFNLGMQVPRKLKGSGEVREGTSSFTEFIAKENASWARPTHFCNLSH